MVEGTINGFPFRAALEPNGKGSHWLRVNKVVHDAASADAGDTVTVEITRAGEEPQTRVPMDLRKALAAAPLAQALWADITPIARRDWILWISSAKQPETRRRRIEKACAMLASGKRGVCCFGGIKWLMKNHGTTGGIWLQLPKSEPVAQKRKSRMKSSETSPSAQVLKTSQPEEFDLVILRGGTGSTIAAWTFAGEGKQVAVVERKYIGG